MGASLAIAAGAGLGTAGGGAGVVVVVVVVVVGVVVGSVVVVGGKRGPATEMLNKDNPIIWSQFMVYKFCEKL